MKVATTTASDRTPDPLTQYRLTGGALRTGTSST